MQLGKNNNTMWHIISKVDLPLPHLLWHPDLNKHLESQFKTAKATGSPEKLCTALRAASPHEALKSENANEVSL